MLHIIRNNYFLYIRSNAESGSGETPEAAFDITGTIIPGEKSINKIVLIKIQK